MDFDQKYELIEPLPGEGPGASGPARTALVAM